MNVRRRKKSVKRCAKNQEKSTSVEAADGVEEAMNGAVNGGSNARKQSKTSLRRLKGFLETRKSFKLYKNPFLYSQISSSRWKKISNQ
mmetsp:Transcript_20404/g.46971  ORF Transcript_20404/g.46971 Transcript_20404/m.46971 type:complete len:88 (+) Transcript_20404:519-782(+)